MATLTASAAQSNVPAKYRINGVIERVVQYSLTGNPALSTGDVIQMLTVPKYCMILGVSVITDQLSGGNYTFNVGDGNSTSRYFLSLSSGSTSSVFAPGNAAFQVAGIGYSYSTDDTIDIVVGTATTATTSGVVKLLVKYTLDNG